jgi:hypothetical protein
LTTPVPISPELSTFIELTSRQVLRSISLTHASRKDEGLVFNEDDLTTPYRIGGSRFMPSISACLQRSRRAGGAFDLFGTCPKVQLSGDLSVQRVKGVVDRWRRETFVVACLRSQSNSYTDAPKVDRRSAVKVTIIPEPAKFRIITKGDGYLYTALQPLQGLLLDAWKSCFASTMTGSLMDKVRALDLAVDEPLWCSGDYKAATDKLSADACRAALRCLARTGLPIIESMTQNLVLYPRSLHPDGDTWEGEVKTTIRQTNGQLMGHPLSFPVLCIVNLAVYRFSIKKWVKLDSSRRARGRIMWDHVLINGDDILFKCDRSFFEVWTQVTRSVGFVVSVGKNYLSPDMALINSKLFQRVGGLMTVRGYVNLKLLLGYSLKTGESEASPFQIARDLNQAFSCCPRFARALPSAFERWNGAWRSWFRPNWYLPIHLGGLGIDPVWAEKLFITRSQRLAAAMLVVKPDIALTRIDGNMRMMSTGLLGVRPKILPLCDEGPVVSLTIQELISEDLPYDSGLSWIGWFAYVTSVMYRPPEPSKFRFVPFPPKDRFLTPMSDAGILRWWRVLLRFPFLPSPPPFSPLRYPLPAAPLHPDPGWLYSLKPSWAEFSGVSELTSQNGVSSLPAGTQ